MTAIRDYLRAVAADPGGVADAELLARFAATRDEAAFELLVWRHAALVRRVCRSVLRDHHAAEDAAQAAFLVVARRAGTFAGRGAVVGWLVRVARRTAVRLAKQRARPPGPLPHPDRLPAGEVADAAESAEQAALLWAEIDRLPERYRVPVLLCAFEGLTHPEAARRTGWPVGTVAGRLSRAKALLARRLAAKGVGLSVGVVGLPAGSFVGATARAATGFAAGQSGLSVSAVVVSLAEGVTRAMTVSTLKLTAVAVALAGGLAAGVWAGGGPGPAADDTPAPPKPVAADKPAAPKVADAITRVKVQRQLKEIAFALHNYEGGFSQMPRDITSEDGKRLLSWRVLILPYIEQGDLYRQFKIDEPWDSPTNQKVAQLMPAVYRLPSQPDGDTKTYFQGLAGPGTLFEPGKKLTDASITDGPSKTLGVVVGGPPVEWTRPADLPFDPKKPKLPQMPLADVFLASNCDGSVRLLSPKLDPDVFRRLAVKDDGEVIGEDEIARADPGPLTDLDRVYARRLLVRNDLRVGQIVELLDARKKLLADKAKRNAVNPTKDADLDALLTEEERLDRLYSDLKADLDKLRKELEKGKK